MKLQELRNLIRTEVRKVIRESKRPLKEASITKALSSINYSKVTKAFKEMKSMNFEDEFAQEDFINEINNIVTQLGIDVDLINEPDIISGFLETVQEDTVSAMTMLRELKSFLREMLADNS
jgi:hypothetical protein